MTTFKYCATGLFALAAMIGTAQAENAAWFTENTTSVTKALSAAGVSDDGTWSTTGTLAESLYVDVDKVCVDTDGANRLTYTPKIALSSNTAVVKLENICFTAPVEVNDSQLDGVQAAVAIVEDSDSGDKVFKVADNGEWVTATDFGQADASSTYTITCTFDYDAGTVVYALQSGEEYTANIPSDLTSTKVSTTEFEGTCSFASLTGEKEATTYTLTLPAVTGIASYTVGEETKASGDWSIAEGATPTVTANLADGYFAKGTSITLPAMAGDVTLTAAQVTEAMELVEGEAMIDTTTYKTLQDAADAVADGATIKVRRNVETKDAITFTNKTGIVFDLNGKTITYTNTNYAVNIFDTTITLNSSAAGGRFEKPASGTLVLVGSGTMKHGCIATATVTVDGGTWYCASASGSCFKLENGSVDLTGGVVEHAVMTENLEQVAFNVTTNNLDEVSKLYLNGGIVKGYIARNAAATQTYNDDCLTMFSIKQDELCAEGFEMAKEPESDYYTIQKKQTPATFEVTFVNGANSMITPAAGTSNFVAGTELTITATAVANYAFTNETYEGWTKKSDTELTKEVTITAAVTITAPDAAEPATVGPQPVNPEDPEVATKVAAEVAKIKNDATMKAIIGTDVEIYNAYAAWAQKLDDPSAVYTSSTVAESFAFAQDALLDSPVVTLESFGTAEAEETDNQAFAFTFTVKDGLSDVTIENVVASAVAKLVKCSSDPTFGEGKALEPTITVNGVVDSVVAVTVELPKTEAKAFMKVGK